MIKVFIVFLIMVFRPSKLKCAKLQRALERSQWEGEATKHRELMTDLLYPKLSNGGGISERRHAVARNPIFNFLHRYYRYSASELLRYSPGIGTFLLDVQLTDMSILHPSMVSFNNRDLTVHYSCNNMASEGRYSPEVIRRARDILAATSMRPPHFGCFGLHEWAMLYSNLSTDLSQQSRHQEFLSNRVPQDVIDKTVDSLLVRCTHFDAWRFFHPAAQELNTLNPMRRQDQVQHEQPACVHATMDLFKYAFRLYPLVPAAILGDSLALAVQARKVDMRASPYDVSAFEGCEEPLRVETAEGRFRYVEEQEKLMLLAAPVRKALLEAYSDVVSTIDELAVATAQKDAVTHTGRKNKENSPSSH